MKKILVPTDFSLCAENALEFAVQTAKLFPASLVLLHAFDLPSTLQADYMGVNLDFRQKQWEEDQKQMEQLKMNIEVMHNVLVDIRLVAGTVKDVLGELLNSEEEFDLILMGTSGAGGLMGKLWGSNTADVIARSHVPVLAIPRDYKWRKPEKFLLATGNFEKEPAILDTIFELAALYMAHVDVAVFTNEKDELAVFLEHERNAPYYREMLTKKYSEYDMTTTQLSGKRLERSLEEYIDKRRVDVLVMITYKKDFWDRLFHGSHTRNMSFHTKVPLLAVPAEKGQGRRPDDLF